MHPKQAPVNLNLLSIRFPVTAVISILHRITGLLLFISMPFCLYLLELFHGDAKSAQLLGSLMSRWYVEMALVLIFWSLAHHLYAGVRYLLLDVDIGIARSSARLGAWLVVALDILTLVFLAGVLL